MSTSTAEREAPSARSMLDLEVAGEGQSVAETTSAETSTITRDSSPHRRRSSLSTLLNFARFATPSPRPRPRHRPTISRPIANLGEISIPGSGAFIYVDPERPRLAVEIPRSSFSDLWGRRPQDDMERSTSMYALGLDDAGSSTSSFEPSLAGTNSIYELEGDEPSTASQTVVASNNASSQHDDDDDDDARSMVSGATTDNLNAAYLIPLFDASTPALPDLPNTSTPALPNLTNASTDAPRSTSGTASEDDEDDSILGPLPIFHNRRLVHNLSDNQEMLRPASQRFMEIQHPNPLRSAPPRRVAAAPSPPLSEATTAPPARRGFRARIKLCGLGCGLLRKTKVIEVTEEEVLEQRRRGRESWYTVEEFR